MEKDRQSHPDPVNENSDGAEAVHSPAKSALIVKFKLRTVKEPTSLPLVAPAMVAEEEEEEEGFSCGECHKTFSSSKALGGHVSSVHVQAANRDFLVERAKSKTRKRNFLQLSGWCFTSGKFICNVCGKDFATHQSLYGHMMRCHPDEVRRMNRQADPPKTSTEQQSSVTDGGSCDAVDDDEIYNPPLRWLARGHRGRLATNPVVVHPTPPRSSEEIVADEKMVFTDEDDERVANPSDVQSKKILSSSETPLELDPVEPVGQLLPPARASRNKHICNTCGKSFRRPQALGGHRSTHKKLKMRVHNTIDDQSFRGASMVDPNANANKQLEASNVVLGDQIQCNGTAGGECDHPAGPVSAAIAEAPKEKKVLGFDLNELPDDDGED